MSTGVSVPVHSLRSGIGLAGLDSYTAAAYSAARPSCNQRLGCGALGGAFSVDVCPFCTPALVVLPGVSASVGSIVFGTLLLLVFALGRAVPILLGGWAMGVLEELKFFAGYQKAFEVAGGVVLILAGLCMLNAFFLLTPALAV